MLKKDGKSLWIVQSLKPLNKVTITHSGIPPFTKQLVEQFAGCADAIIMLLPAEIAEIAPIHKGYKIDRTS